MSLKRLRETIWQSEQVLLSKVNHRWRWRADQLLQIEIFISRVSAHFSNVCCRFHWSVVSVKVSIISPDKHSHLFQKQIELKERRKASSCSRTCHLTIKSNQQASLCLMRDRPIITHPTNTINRSSRRTSHNLFQPTIQHRSNCREKLDSFFLNCAVSTDKRWISVLSNFVHRQNNSSLSDEKKCSSFS